VCTCARVCSCKCLCKGRGEAGGGNCCLFPEVGRLMANEWISLCAFQLVNQFVDGLEINREGDREGVCVREIDRETKRQIENDRESVCVCVCTYVFVRFGVRVRL